MLDMIQNVPFPLLVQYAEYTCISALVVYMYVLYLSVVHVFTYKDSISSSSLADL